MTSQQLVQEHLILRTHLAAHRMLIDRAVDALDSAIEGANIPVRYGRYEIDLQAEGWRYPSIAQAQRELRALRDDSGFYWAESRLTDLERLLGLDWQPQLPLPFPGMVPPPHPMVRQFLLAAA